MALFDFLHGDPLMIDHTPSSAVSAGDVVIVAGKACIAHTDIPADTLGAVAWPNGRAVYVVGETLTIQTDEGETFAPGITFYVESDTTTFSEVSTDNYEVGVMVDDLDVGTGIVHGG
jgi:predicted RecA/RadA family phage recombinase